MGVVPWKSPKPVTDPRKQEASQLRSRFDLNLKVFSASR
jgi:hypothetical protein